MAAKMEIEQNVVHLRLLKAVAKTLAEVQLAAGASANNLAVEKISNAELLTGLREAHATLHGAVIKSGKEALNEVRETIEELIKCQNTFGVAANGNDPQGRNVPDWVEALQTEALEGKNYRKLINPTYLLRHFPGRIQDLQRSIKNSAERELEKWLEGSVVPKLEVKHDDQAFALISLALKFETRHSNWTDTWRQNLLPAEMLTEVIAMSGAKLAKFLNCEVEFLQANTGLAHYAGQWGGLNQKLRRQDLRAEFRIKKDR